MKKLTAILLTAAMIITVIPPVSAAQTNLTIDSVLEILKYLSKLPSEYDSPDNKLTEPTMDNALEILKYLAKLPSVFDDFHETDYELNTNHVIVYAVNDEAAEFAGLTIPDGYPQSFQILINGEIRDDVRWQIYGEYYLDDGNKYHDWVSPSGIINSTGLVSPVSASSVIRDGITYKEYKYRTFEMRAVINERILEFKITFIDYAKALSERIVDEWLESNINTSMTDMEKAQAITEYVGSFPRTGGFLSQGPASLPVYGFGCCVSSSGLSAEMLQKAGLRAGIQGGGIYQAAPSHIVAVAEIDGNLYEIESNGLAIISPYNKNAMYGDIVWYNGKSIFEEYTTD